VCRDHIRDCDLLMRLLDGRGGALAVTSLRVIFTLLGVQLLHLLQPHMPSDNLLCWWMLFMVLHSCTSSTVIVRVKSCGKFSTAIPLFKDRYSPKD
jgi:hypothetical protein